jgi:mannose-1-phosphate guanylyltransferase
MIRLAKRESLRACAVLLAGGRGTRFWPRSRMRTPKQLLNIAGRATMLRETVTRLQAVFGLRNFWAVTNLEQAAAVQRELRGVPASHILAEPVGRNTAAAIGLAAIHLAHEYGDALMAVLPADSYIGNAARYRELTRAALHLARGERNLVVLGISPMRAETGYGYIERGAPRSASLGVHVFSVKRFTEKPEEDLAREYVDSGKYLWNAGMFFWRVSTYMENLRQFLPATHDALQQLGKTVGTPRYASSLRRIYPRLKNISVDYAILEPATLAGGTHRVYVIPAKVGWSDIGSWAAVYELLAKELGANVSAGPFFALGASGNYFWCPKKFVAAIGVRNLVLVETDDAILLCSRDRSQEVGKIVKWLETEKKKELL